MRSANWLWPTLLIALAIAIGVAALYNVAGPPERDLMRDVALRDGRSPDAVIETAQWITWAGDAAQRSVVMVAFALWLWFKSRWRAALVMMVTVPLAGVTSSILKEIYARPRPSVVPHLDLVTSFSYPSGHAVNAMAVLLLGALLLATKARGLWIALAVLAAIVIGGSRAILGVHYPSDIVGGWLIGIAFALIGWRVAERLEPSAPAPSEPPVLSPAQSHSPPPPSDAPHPSATVSGFPPPPA